MLEKVSPEGQKCLWCYVRWKSRVKIFGIQYCTVFKKITGKNPGRLYWTVHSRCLCVGLWWPSPASSLLHFARASVDPLYKRSILSGKGSPRARVTDVRKSLLGFYNLTVSGLPPFYASCDWKTRALIVSSQGPSHSPNIFSDLIKPLISLLMYSELKLHFHRVAFSYCRKKVYFILYPFISFCVLSFFSIPFTALWNILKHEKYSRANLFYPNWFGDIMLFLFISNTGPG